jgi:hypothetical protein
MASPQRAPPTRPAGVLYPDSRHRASRTPSIGKATVNSSRVTRSCSARPDPKAALLSQLGSRQSGLGWPASHPWPPAGSGGQRLRANPGIPVWPAQSPRRCGGRLRHRAVAPGGLRALVSSTASRSEYGILPMVATLPAGDTAGGREDARFVRDARASAGRRAVTVSGAHAGQEARRRASTAPQFARRRPTSATPTLQGCRAKLVTGACVGHQGVDGFQPRPWGPASARQVRRQHCTAGKLTGPGPARPTPRPPGLGVRHPHRPAVVAALLAARRCIHAAASSACSAYQAAIRSCSAAVGWVWTRTSCDAERTCARVRALLSAIARALVGIALTAHGLAGHPNRCALPGLRGAARNPSLLGSQHRSPEERGRPCRRYALVGRRRRGKRHRRQRGIASAHLVTGTTSGEALSAAFLECGP